MLGGEAKVITGVVKNVYTSYVELVEDNGKVIFVNQNTVTYVRPDV
jgi:hypothetical protein